MGAASSYSQADKREDASRATPSRCANCEIEILWPPTFVQERTYCCTGCAEGGPCTCDYSQYLSVKISGVIHYMEEGDRPEQK